MNHCSERPHHLCRRRPRRRRRRRSERPHYLCRRYLGLTSSAEAEPLPKEGSVLLGRPPQLVACRHRRRSAAPTRCCLGPATRLSRVVGHIGGCGRVAIATAHTKQRREGRGGEFEASANWPGLRLAVTLVSTFLSFLMHSWIATSSYLS